MKTDDALRLLGEHFGVLSSFRDLAREEHPTSPDTQKALLRANGLVLDNDPMISEALADIQAGAQARKYPPELIIQSQLSQALSIPGISQWQIIDTDLNVLIADGDNRQSGTLDLPELPSGVYELLLNGVAGKGVVTLIVAPERAPSLQEACPRETKATRLWGVTAALYALRSGRNTGIGDFSDLALLGELLAGQSAGFVGINPVHAIGITATDVFSPYSPSHRGLLNTAHLALDAIPGLEESTAAQQVVEEATRASAAQSTEHFIDYPLCQSAHTTALKALHRCFAESAEPAEQQAFADFQSMANSQLTDFVLYEAISELHGPDFHQWPTKLREKKPEAIEAIRQTLIDELPFHYWLQWVANRQLGDVQARLKNAGMPLGLYLDLAVGARRSGAESWCEVDAIATGVSIGAPPDHLSPAGQNWNLAAFAPAKLKLQKYQAFRRVIRAAIQHAGVLRIDHVLGLNRSFWIPDDGSPGAYIRQPFEALLAIVKIEAEKAGTVIIGEDLGLVPAGFRETMRAHGIYGYSVLQFEKNSAGDFRDPADYESQILGCFSTHDTATLAGYLQGSDIDWWHKLGWIDQAAVASAKSTRQQDVTKICGLARDETSFSAAVHTSLAQSPAALVSVQLDDILENTQAQNLPGTIDEHPNWRRRYATAVEELAGQDTLGVVAQCMRKGMR